MITPDGIIYLKQFMAGMQSSVAEAISFGISGAAYVSGDPMGFELDHSSVKLISYSFSEDVLIVKSSLPAEIEGVIYEIGLVSNVSDYSNSKIISTLDSANEAWVGGTWQTSFNRIGADSLRLAPTASGTLSAKLDDISIDLSDNAGSDKFVIAFNNLNGNTASVVVKFYTDDTNYYSIIWTTPASGYKILKVSKSTATSTGNPDWGNINGLGLSVSATGSGSAQVDIDGIRIQNSNNVDPDYTLIARTVLDTPYTKIAGRSEDIEYRLAVSIS